MFVCGFKGFCFCVSVFIMLFAFVSLFVDPLYGGSWLLSELFLGFVSVSVFELSAVCLSIT